MRNKVLVTPVTTGSDDAFGQFFAMAAALNGIEIPDAGVEATVRLRIAGREVDALEVLSAMVLARISPPPPTEAAPAPEVVAPYSPPPRSDLPTLVDPMGEWAEGEALLMTAATFHTIYTRLRQLSPAVVAVEELKQSVVGLVEELVAEGLYAKLADLRKPLITMLQELDRGERVTEAAGSVELTRRRTRTHLEESIPGLMETMEAQRTAYNEVNASFQSDLLRARVEELFEMQVVAVERTDEETGEVTIDAVRSLLALGGANGESRHAAE